MTPRRLRPALVSALAAAALLAGCSGSDDDAAPSGPSYAGSPARLDGLRVPARVQGPDVKLALDGRFERRFWPGVDLGPTVPGRLAGEVSATRADYDRWLRGIGELGARVVRVYTILRPAFYDALAAYNRAHPDRPLHVIHGVWIPDERFVATGDAYDPQVTAGFRAELRDAVAAIHGDADLPQRRGHAGGRYRSDVSRWVLAWSIGVEWDPRASASTDRRNAGAPPHRGRYVVAAPEATPMESWIAAMLDHVATLEARRGWSRPLTFTNWLTTDPLHHPDEPIAREDAVSIDALHLRATPAWPGGLFASYHAYPYYPDFLRLQASYQRPHDGRVDPYAAYLRELRAHHRGQAVMITEFGVPSSLGAAHRGPLGRDQGDHSEADAGRIDAELLRTIQDEGFAGGILFAYVDEWFKATWNTTELELPAERRQLWRNPLTNEEHFGVVAAEPGERPVAVLDGDDGEWQDNGSQVVHESRGAIRELRAVKDEESLQLRLRLDRSEPWRARPLRIGLDVRPGGNRGLPGLPGVAPDADVAVTIGPGERASIVQASWTDPVAFQYGLNRGYVPFDPADLRPGSGRWVSPRLILNRPYVVPTTRERRPVELMSLGRLPWGTTDPDADGFDRRHLVDAEGEVVELRLPWALLGFSDPSSRRVAVPRRDGSIATRRVERVGIAIAPPDGQAVETNGYAWDEWNAVRWHERRKRGWNAVAEAFARAAAR